MGENRGLEKSGEDTECICKQEWFRALRELNYIRIIREIDNWILQGFETGKLNQEIAHKASENRN